MKTMPEINGVGEVIVSREMSFIFDDGRKEKVSLKVGKPFEYSNVGKVRRGFF
jgi:hypothetical protein